MKRIFYFTNSYPYGIGESWKTEELEYLSTAFDKIIVVPFFYGRDNQFKGINKNNISYLDPLFSDFPEKSLLNKLTTTLSHRKFLVFIKELISNKGLFNKSRILAWLASTNRIIELDRNKRFKNLIKSFCEEDTLFFFWGRKTSEYLGTFNLVGKKIIRFHGYDLYAYRNRGNYIPYQRNQLNNTDIALCISKDGKSYLQSQWPELAHKIKVNYLGIINDKSANLAKTNNNSFNGKLKIFSCSSLIPLKRISLIMHALLLIDDVEIEWTHIGDGPEKEKIIDLSRGLKSNIDFQITGWISKDEIFNLFLNKSPNLFINVSTSEGLSVSIMEACSFGLPIIATNVGGTSEIVDENNGCLVDRNISAEVLADTIRDFSKISKKQYLALCESSNNKFISNFDSRNTKKELIRLIA